MIANDRKFLENVANNYGNVLKGTNKDYIRVNQIHYVAKL